MCSGQAVPLNPFQIANIHLTNAAFLPFRCSTRVVEQLVVDMGRVADYAMALQVYDDEPGSQSPHKALVAQAASQLMMYCSQYELPAITHAVAAWMKSLSTPALPAGVSETPAAVATVRAASQGQPLAALGMQSVVGKVVSGVGTAVHQGVRWLLKQQVMKQVHAQLARVC